MHKMNFRETFMSPYIYQIHPSYFLCHKFNRKAIVVKSAGLRYCPSLCSDIFTATGQTLKPPDLKHAACYRLSSVRALITLAKQQGSLQMARLIPQLPLSCDYLLSSGRSMSKKAE